MAETKTCGRCGFLAKVRRGKPSRTDSESIDLKERTSGEFGDAYPICFASKLSRIRLEDEYAEAAKAAPDHWTHTSYPQWHRSRIAALDVFNRSRDSCAGWFEWDENLTPREHMELWRMLELRKMRDESEKRTQSAMDRDYKVAQRALSVGQTSIKVAIVTIVIGICAALGQIWVGYLQLEEARRVPSAIPGAAPLSAVSSPTAVPSLSPTAPVPPSTVQP